MGSTALTLPQRVQESLQHRCGMGSMALLLVGVSGGPDSLCLLDVLHTLGSRVIVGHFDHQLRPESRDEARAVASEASHRSLRFVLGREDVGAYARDRKLSLEDAARKLRYAFLFGKAREMGADAVVVGHTADDQAETLLIHLIRGAGLAGLKGMQHRTVLPEFDGRIPLVRPLLDTWRSEVEAYCDQRDLHPRFDPSNASSVFLRNRVRNELMPLLESYNPEFRRALSRTAESLASDFRLLNEYVDGAWSDCLLLETPVSVQLADTPFQAASPDLRRHLLRMAVHRLSSERRLDHAALLRALATAGGPYGKRLDLGGGISVIREPDAVSIARNLDELPTNAWPQMLSNTEALPLPIPGSVDLDGGWSIRAEEAETASSAVVDSGPYSATLDANSLPPKLEVRVRRPGDRFSPLGMGSHSQKLSDLFINAKVPTRLRSRWPLVCAPDGIVWIPGFRPAEACRRTSRTASVLRLLAIPPSSST